jgi:hypothetical protein
LGAAGAGLDGERQPGPATVRPLIGAVLTIGAVLAIGAVLVVLWVLADRLGRAHGDGAR